MKKLIIHFFIFAMLVVPVFSFAQQDPKGLVPCDNTPTITGDKITYAHPCDFNAFLALINKIIHFVLFDLVVPIAAIMFAYAGFKLVTSGGSPEAKSKAKSIFTNTVIGFVVAVGAWLIIRTILSVLGYQGAWIFDKF